MTDLPVALEAVPASPRAASSSLTDARLLDRVEAALAALGTLAAVYLHVFFCRHVGALWRDEVNSVNLATLPSFAQTWDKLQFDSFPILFLALLRGWAALFGADNDAALRVLGLLIGLGIVGALWLNARLFGARWPLCSLVLLGVNPLFIRYADSMRAHGLGILLILLTVAAVWRVLDSPRPGRVALAAALAVLSVQANYYNAVLLLAVGVAGAVAAGREGRWRAAACAVGVGVPAALSLAIYAGTIRRVGEWNFLLKRPVTLPWLWHKLGEVTGAPEALGTWVWTGLFLGALGLAGAWLWTRRHAAPVDGSPDRALLFAVATLVVLTVAYPGFLLVLHYATEPWYYLSYLALVGVCLDAVFGRVLAATGHAAGRVARTLGCAALAALTFAGARDSLGARQTDVDFVAARLNALARPGDLVVFSRWECAITFARYYHGAAPLATLPPLSGHDYHRYDEIKAQMMAADPLAPVLAAMEATLRGGHRVWLAGPLAAPADGEPPRRPAPLRLDGGRVASAGGDYYGAWTEQAGSLLQQHATALLDVPINTGQPVMPYEKIRLTGLEGWH